MSDFMDEMLGSLFPGDPKTRTLDEYVSGANVVMVAARLPRITLKKTGDKYSFKLEDRDEWTPETNIEGAHIWIAGFMTGIAVTMKVYLKGGGES